MKTMWPDVFEGGQGDLVICQEWPGLKEDAYVRVIVPMAEARKLAAEIIAVADRAEKRGGGDVGSHS